MSETAVVTERNLELESSKTAAGPGLVKAHTGIRGLLAFYIMLFHALAFSAGWNLHGARGCAVRNALSRLLTHDFSDSRLAWLGHQGTRAVAALIIISIVVPPTGALLKSPPSPYAGIS
jgi:hypothetical protein